MFAIAETWRVRIPSWLALRIIRDEVDERY
jgi:hypothetical protein